MAITLQEAKVGMADKIVAGVIDIFQRSSLLLDRLVFDNAVAAGGKGSTLTYGYLQTTTPATAAVRKINADYTPGEAKRTKKTAQCAIMGGNYEIDRVIIGTAGEVDELAYQAEEKVKATANEFTNMAINGDADNDSGEFDGLKKLLAGTDSEYTSTVDVSTSAKVKSNGNELIDELDALIAHVPGCNMILTNLTTLLKIRSAARAAGYYANKRDEFGRNVETFNGIEMVDAGKYYDADTHTEKDIVPVESDGTSYIYAVAIGLDGFHGISPQGDKVIDSHLPDLTAPGAVKTGDVELVAGVALKDSHKAGVLKGLKVKAAST